MIYNKRQPGKNRRLPVLYGILGVLCLVLVVTIYHETEGRKEEGGVAARPVQAEATSSFTKTTVRKKQAEVRTAEVSSNTKPEKKKLQRLEEPAPYIGDVMDLDSTSQPWSYNVDRAKDFQQQYGMYNADCYGQGKNAIYITLNCAIENGYTEQMLDVLKEKDVRIAIFMTKRYAMKNPDIVKRMIRDGHQIGSHSCYHPQQGFENLTIEEQKADLKEFRDYMKKEFHYNPVLFRFPSGMYSVQSMAVVGSMGYRSVFYNFAYEDWYTDQSQNVSEAAAYDALVAAMQPGCIYQLHNTSEANLKVMGDFIDTARKKGFKLPDYR